MASQNRGKASTADQTPGEDPCILKTIPPEIRNYIFTLAIVNASAIQAVIKAPLGTDSLILQNKSLNPNDLAGLALAKTCRQFHNEALAVFYQDNTFCLYRQTTIKNRDHEDEYRWNPPTYTPSSDSDSRSLSTALSKVRSVILNMHDYIKQADGGWKYFHHVGQIHVIADSEGNLSVRTTGTLEGKCVCAIKKRARECTGEEGGVGRVVERFLKEEQWDRLEGSAIRFAGSRRSCTDCGGAKKAPSPPQTARKRMGGRAPRAGMGLERR